MDILGIGPLEIILILLIALIILGPRDMAKTGRSIGRTLRKVVKSPYWQALTRTSQEIRNLPNRLIREAGLEDLEKDVANLNQETRQIKQVLRDATILPPTFSLVNESKPDAPPGGDTVSDSVEGAASQSLPEEKDPSPSINTPTDTQGAPNREALFSWVTPPKQTDPKSSQSIDLSTWITPGSVDFEEEGLDS